MTARQIAWINDQGLVVGQTVAGAFGSPPSLGPLALSADVLTLGIPASGAILGASAGSTITGGSLPPGITINTAPGWAYDGGGTAGSFIFMLTETLTGSANSPNITSLALAIVASAMSALDFSQPANSGLIAALRSF